MNSSIRNLLFTAIVTGITISGVAAVATMAPGTPGKDVTEGLDNDNAANAFIQPPGVVAKQHMDNTDLLFGRANDDLLRGNLGDDVLVGGSGKDITIGGPENFTPINSDVVLGGNGKDVNIWAPGDGSDAYAGEDGYDTMIFAPFVTDPATGDLKLEHFRGRLVPRVDITNKPAFTCELVPVPESENLGAQFLVRFEVNGVPAVTVRQKDVERVLCPSPIPGKLTVAELTDAHPAFHLASVNSIHGVTGAIVATP